MKRNRLWLLLIISMLVLSPMACAAPQPPSAEEAPPIPPEEVPLPPPEEVPTSTTEALPQISYEVTHDPESRWQDITLIIKDQDGNPLPNTEVSFEQQDIDFLFGDEYGGIPYQLFMQKYAQKYWELGLNHWKFGLYWLWSTIEPEKGEFRWWLDYPPKHCGEIFAGEQEECRPDQWEEYGVPEDRLESFTGSAVMGLYYPSFAENAAAGNFPAWADPDDIDGSFRKDYEDFLKAVVSHYKGRVHVYRVGLEVNIGQWTGVLAEKDYPWAVEWIKWQCNLIRSIDPSAKISIELSDQRDMDPVDPQTLDWTGMQPPNPMWEDDFIRMLLDAGADFDWIGVEYHPGWNTTLEKIEENLTRLEQFNKPIYVWEVFVPSMDEPLATDVCNIYGICPEGGYSEEFQKQQLLAFFKMVIEDHPTVVGVEYLGFVGNPDDESWIEYPVPQSAGLLNIDGTPKPAYTAIKEYWHSLMAKGSATTDQNGEITLNAIPGLFLVTVDGQAEVIHMQ